MAPLIPGMENVNWFGIVGQSLYYIQWAFYGAIICTFMAIAYYMLVYNIKAEVYPVYGSGGLSGFSIGKKKTNKFCWNKNKTAWKPLFPLFNKEEYEPFPPEHIYDGGRVVAFQHNGKLYPAQISVKETKEGISGSIKPVPYHIRNWQSLQHKKNAMEYADKSWWDDNKTMVYGLLFATACMITALVFIYMSYKMVGPGTAAMDRFASALEGFGNIPGTKPM